MKEEEKGRESEKEEEVLADMLGNPRKRQVDEASMQVDTNVQIPQTPSPGPSISLSEEMIEILVGKSGEVITKNRRRV